MGRSHWGSLKYDRGSKTARIRYWATGADGYRRRSLTLRNVTKREAERRMASLMLEHSEDAPCPTVGKVWESWVLPEIDHRIETGDMAANSRRVYASAYETHVRERWHDVQCDSVKALDVQQWLLDGKTKSQAEAARRVMSLIMEKAVMYEAVKSNVMRARYLMPKPGEGRDKGIWTLQELGKVWEGLMDTPIEAPFLLSAFGSCRVGESLGVKGEDVERMGDVTVVSIRRQVDQSGNITERLKTASSRRVVVLPGIAGERIAAMDAEWLADDGTGKPFSQKVLNARFSKMLPKGLRHPFRNLRNSWETYTRWDLGVPPWCSETLMGHEGADVTGRYYDRPDTQRLAGTISDAWRRWVEAGNHDPLGQVGTQ